MFAPGAFGTPQLLMLPGICLADHLKLRGMETLINHPGLGANLADHVDVSLQYAPERMELSHARYQRLDRAAMLMARWLWNRSGPGGGALISSVLFHAFDDSALPEPEVFMTPMIVEENLGNGTGETTPMLERLGLRLLVRGRKAIRPSIQVNINLERPKSFGAVWLASADPIAHPLIGPNHFADPCNLDACVRGVRVGVMREIRAKTESIRYFQGKFALWIHVCSREEIVDANRLTDCIGHHPCSTARMEDGCRCRAGCTVACLRCFCKACTKNQRQFIIIFNELHIFFC